MPKGTGSVPKQNNPIRGASRGSNTFKPGSTMGHVIVSQKSEVNNSCSNSSFHYGGLRVGNNKLISQPLNSKPMTAGIDSENLDSSPYAYGFRPVKLS